jgi:dihydropteroate synthase
VRLALRGHDFDLRAGAPLVMGIVNATPDSFSDRQGPKGLKELVDRGMALVEQGADMVDVGGESGRTDRPAVSEEEEAGRIAGLVGALADRGVPVSVDTWRTGPARAALEAGAAMVNDVSGLAEPALAALSAEFGAALVITHTRAEPKTKAFPDYEDVVADVTGFLRERMGEALAAGVPEAAVLLDPGLDIAKSPAESVEILRRVAELDVLGRPLLLAVSRKDFVGAVTGRLPSRRGPGTLAALEPALEVQGAVVRVHDVAATRDFLAVRSALRGDLAVAQAPLDERLRRED